MIFSALISFLGGATARAAIGSIITWLEKKQEHAQEMERQRLQAELDERAHERSMALVRLQADLKLSEIRLAGDTAVALEEARAFTAAQERANQPTGSWLIDAWNGSIRPGAATIALAIWGLKLFKQSLAVTDWDMNLISSILGYYFADRHMGKARR